MRRLNHPFDFILCSSLVIVLVLLPSSLPQSLYAGFCPNVVGMSNFNMTKFLGIWNEAEGYSFFAETTLDCIYEDFYDNNNGTYTKVIYAFEKLSQRKKAFPGILKFVQNENIADFELRVIVTGNSQVDFRSIYPYKVIYTDYTSYAIEYSCRQVGFTYLQQIWVIIRDRTYTSDLKKRVREKILSLGLDTSRLINRQQYSCPANYWENEKRYNSI